MLHGYPDLPVSFLLPLFRRRQEYVRVILESLPEAPGLMNLFFQPYRFLHVN